jgi:hypothetical protein
VGGWAKHTAEQALMASTLTWAILRPGGLTDQPGTGPVQLGTHVPFGDIPRADVAALASPASAGHAWGPGQRHRPRYRSCRRGSGRAAGTRCNYGTAEQKAAAAKSVKVNEYWLNVPGPDPDVASLPVPADHGLVICAAARPMCDAVLVCLLQPEDHNGLDHFDPLHGAHWPLCPRGCEEPHQCGRHRLVVTELSSA